MTLYKPGYCETILGFMDNLLCGLCVLLTTCVLKRKALVVANVRACFESILSCGIHV